MNYRPKRIHETEVPSKAYKKKEEIRKRPAERDVVEEGKSIANENGRSEGGGKEMENRETN